jgi:nucleoside-diphosphate-sugar epimerase
LAAALRRHLPRGTAFVARSASSRECLSVGDYRAVTPALFSGMNTVINCAGVTTGSSELMQQANVETPVHLASIARAAGVKRFVHVSSFSVYGRVSHIDANTPVAPETDYGRSKRTAEERLIALAGTEFSTIPVRLPAIVGAGSQDKLRRLIRLWLRLRRFPAPRAPVLRSMITVDLAAKALAEIALSDDTGILCAADSDPFTYENAARAISSGIQGKVGLLKLPNSILWPIEQWAPSLFASLYQQSLLEVDINRAAAIPSDLYLAITRMAQEESKA